MADILLIQEGSKGTIGSCLWKFAGERNEAVYLYARRILGDSEHRDPRGSTRPNGCTRSYYKPFGQVRLGRFSHEEYSLYLPTSDKDLNEMLSYTFYYRGEIEVATPAELDPNKWEHLASLWDTFRPLRYLSTIDLCESLGVPWVYILSIYNYDPSLAVACLGTSEAAADLASIANSTGATLWPLKEALGAENQVWKKNYSSVDPER